MSKSLAATERLERLANSGRAAGDRDAIEIAEVFDAWRRGEVADLPAALGLKPAAGERDPRSHILSTKRDEIVRDGINRFFPNLSLAQAAKKFAAGLKLYRDSTAWQKSDRKSDDLPARLRGKIKGVYWSVLKVTDSEMHESTIRKHLGGAKGWDFAPPEST